MRKVLRSTDINEREVVKINIYVLLSQFTIRNLAVPADELFDVNNNGTSSPANSNLDSILRGTPIYTFELNEQCIVFLMLKL